MYFLALLGDWLQGPYVYKLYAYYGFKVLGTGIMWGLLGSFPAVSFLIPVY